MDIVNTVADFMSIDLVCMYSFYDWNRKVTISLYVYVMVMRFDCPIPENDNSFPTETVEVI